MRYSMKTTQTRAWYLIRLQCVLAIMTIITTIPRQDVQGELIRFGFLLPQDKHFEYLGRRVSEDSEVSQT